MNSRTPDLKGMRIIFAGTPDFAAFHLKALLDTGADVVAAYTQPDRPAGRGKKLSPSPVKALAVERGLPVYQPLSLRDIEAQQQLENLRPDILVVVAYGLIIPERVLATPTYGCINVHASLLPRWRGAAPIQRAIAAGDKETGVTIMQMDAGLDTGDMLYKATCVIAPDDTGGSLHDKLVQLGPPALIKTLCAIKNGSVKGEPQDNSESCYAAKITKEEARIDWSESASVIDRKVRAFNPFPIAFTSIDGRNLRIWSALVKKPGGQPARPGTILTAGTEGIEIACGEGNITITNAQLPGKKQMAVADLLRGNTSLFQAGSCLGQ